MTVRLILISLFFSVHFSYSINHNIENDNLYLIVYLIKESIIINNDLREMKYNIIIYVRIKIELYI